MGPVGVLATSVLRARWRAALLLVALLGLTGAVALASLAGSRRGRDALDRFIDTNRIGSIEAYVFPGLPPAEQVRGVERMVEAGDDRSLAGYAMVIAALPGHDGTQGEETDVLVSTAPFDDRYLRDVARPIVLEGDLPLGPGEVTVNPQLARRRDVGPGDRLEVALFAPDLVETVGNGVLPEPGALVTVEIAAVVRQPYDLARSPQSQPGTLFESDEATIVFHPGFWAEHGPDLAMYGVGVLGDPPADRLEAVTAAMREAGGENALVNPAPPEDLARLEPVRTAIDLESNTLVVFGLLVIVLGIGLLGAAIARVTGDDESDRDVLHAVGLTRQQLIAAPVARAMVVAAGTLVVAVVGAVALSSLFPIGLAGDAEVDRGVDVDWLVLGVGGAVFAALVVARAAVTGLGKRHRAPAPGRPSRVRAALGRAGPATALGAHMALDGIGARGRAATRAAIATAVAGVVAVAGAATYAASLDRLADTPELQGWNWDVTVGNFSDPDAAAQAEELLAGNDDVDASVGYNWATLDVDELNVPMAEVTEHSELLPVVLEGRAPEGPDEVAFGRGTLRELGKEVGDDVEIRADGPVLRARIVGVVIAPAVIAPPMDLDSGGVVTFDATERVFANQPGASTPVAYLVRFRDGVDRDATLTRVREDFPGTVLGPMAPLDLGDLHRVRGFPYLLAAMLGLLALGSVVLTLASLARRRRREVAVLRSMGFDRAQLRGLVAAQASTFTLAALVVGLPLGLIAGRQAWRLAADGLGTEVGPVVPLLRVALAAAAVLLLVNLCAQVFATRIVRRRPGVDLRAE